MPMVDDVVVQNGAILFILPGTMVPINCVDAFPHLGGLDSTRVEIIVENGALVMDGATLFDPSGMAGCWYGIEFRPGTNGLIQNSLIADAVIGITVNTASVDIVQNTITNLHGQDSIIPGGPGGMGAGILLTGTPTMSNIINNQISGITGGTGMAGMNGFPGTPPFAPDGTAGGNGGDGGLAAGIYLDGVMPPPQIAGNEIHHIQGGMPGVGGNGGNGIGGANQLSLIPPTGGGNGGKGGKGGDGGDAVGIYLTGSDMIGVDNNIHDISGTPGANGGNGGHGGKGGDALPMSSEPGAPGLPGANGGNGGGGGAGGVGGEATGIYDRRQLDSG